MQPKLNHYGGSSPRHTPSDHQPTKVIEPTQKVVPLARACRIPQGVAILRRSRRSP
jgi:hypothetical protein